VAAIEESGGLVSYDAGPVDDPVLNRREPWAPKWLVNAIGLDYFAHASLVVFDRTCSGLSVQHQRLDSGTSNKKRSPLSQRRTV
jgi:hypothetical protein